ncbi:MAG: hypothetical protein ACI96N_002934 [Arenicella sp.]|jgi:hypothetical protein
MNKLLISLYCLHRRSLLTAIMLGCAGSAGATTIPLDFNDFFTADPEVTVVSPGEVVMTDSDFVSVVTLTNDPWYDPNIIIQAVDRTLTFDFEFLQGNGNVDEFAAYLFDADYGPVAGVLDNVFYDASASGTVSFDLSPWTGLMLGLQFELYDPGFLTGSSVTITDLALNDPVSASVPAPGGLAILFAGLALLVGRNRWRPTDTGCRGAASLVRL